MKRYDAEDVLQALREKGIDRLYHITDRENWASIKKYGLLSLDLLNEKEIDPEKSCGDRISRKRRIKKGLGDLVHLSFFKAPICLEQASDAGWIKDPVVLEISLDVFRDDDTAISPTDALVAKSQNVPFVSTLEEIRSLDFDVRKTAEQQNDLLMSEVLVKGFVPTSLFLNAEELDRGEGLSTVKKQALLFILDQTDLMSENLSLQGRFQASAAHAARTAVNDAINGLLDSCISSSDVSDSYEIAILSMSEDIGAAWAPNWGESFVDCKSLYREMIRRLPSDGRKTEWMVEKEPQGKAEPAEAFRRSASLVQDWMFHHQDYLPPLVVFVSNGKSIRDSLQNARKEAGILKSIVSMYGNVCLLCFMLSPDRSAFFEFPTSKDRGKLENLSPESTFLFDISSVLSGKTAESVRETNGRNDDEFRAMGVNGSLLQLIRTLCR